MRDKSIPYFKNVVFLVLLGFIFGKYTTSPEPANLVTTDICDAENNAFQAGEKIEYELYYNWGLLWIPAGYVTFNVKDRDEHIEVTAIGSTFPSYDSFYKVRDTFYSLIDKETLLPVKFYRDIEEGKYVMYSEIHFDQTDHKASSMVQKRGRTRNYEFEYANCMHDLLSILYFFRNMDYTGFDPNHRFPVSLLLDSKVYNLHVRYDGVNARKKIKGMGRYNSLEFSLELIAGHIFNEGDEMKAWVTNDQNKIALMVESPISVGSVKAVLSDYSGLKYKVSSKIQ